MVLVIPFSSWHEFRFRRMELIFSSLRVVPSLLSPVSAFGSLDTTNIDGLAGKYRVGFGTPFDLADLRGVDPSLNVDRVTHVRIIDVVGDGSSLDSQGDPIYDPYPTVGSAGFDLDGVAALHLLDTGESEVGFEDVGSSLADESFFSGPILAVNSQPVSSAKSLRVVGLRVVA